MKAIGLLAAAALIALVAPALAPNGPTTQFPDRAYAPPSRIHFNGLSPFVYRLKLVNRVARTYAEDTEAPVALKWFADGRIVSTSVPSDPSVTSAAAEPLLLRGGETLGRDVLSRLL